VPKTSKKTPRTDYLIVGAGTAGRPLATRLAAAGKQVLLLDASRTPAVSQDTFVPAPAGAWDRIAAQTEDSAWSAQSMSKHEHAVAKQLKPSWLEKLGRTRRDPKTLKAFHGLKVEQVSLDSSQVATGVVAVDARGRRLELRADQVILCAGTLETPKILKRSGIGARAELQQAGITLKVEAPGVGQAETYRYQTSVVSQLRPSTSSSAPELNTRFTARSNPALAEDDLLIEGGRGGRAGQHRWRVSHFAPPQPFDPAPLIEGIAAVRQFVQQHDAQISKELFPGPRFIGSLPSLITRFGSEQPACGTAKLGSTEDPSAVVDSAFQVRGTTNLKVVDASLFPQLPSVSLVAPTLTLAEKAAHDLLARK
jgi:choline dehydrogenase-like flavoprotein